jgi:DNA-binding response OmpR family regulator
VQILLLEISLHRDYRKKIMEKILVVDDETEVCDALREFLSIKGYQVFTAQNGKDALLTVHEKKPHIVLLDIIMPGMSGIETLEEIKKVAPGVGVVMITAVTDEVLGNKALKLGADDFITKPVDLDYLESVLMFKIIDILGC